MTSDDTLFGKLKSAARKLKQNVYVLYLAGRDPRIPWYVKLFALSVAAYAFSPIDLIPDFIPVIGYLDDLILVPLGIYLALKMIPPALLDQYRSRAEEMRRQGKPKNWIIGSLFILTWIVCAVWVGWIVYRRFMLTP
jgi:uncharacterized membrane protein YkvA (DUF1232 family)